MDGLKHWNIMEVEEWRCAWMIEKPLSIRCVKEIRFGWGSFDEVAFRILMGDWNREGNDEDK